MAAVNSRSDVMTLLSALLPLLAAAAYTIVVAIGFARPDLPWLAITASITVSLILWMVSTAWLKGRTRWPLAACIPAIALALVSPMVGAATLGTDLALERRADQVTGVVTDIDVEAVKRRGKVRSHRTTYTFVAADDRRELGTVQYRGDEEAYELEIGDETELMVDPEGELPLKLEERVDSGLDITMLVMGGVLFCIVWAVGLVWPALRRKLDGSPPPHAAR